MNSLQLLSVIASAKLGVILLMMVWGVLERRHLRFQYILVFMLIMIIVVVDELYEINDWWLHWPGFYNWYLPFTYLMAPLVFMYLKCLVQPDKGRRFHWISPHWLGFLLVLLLSMAYFLLDAETKLERLQAPAGTLTHLGLATLGPFLGLLVIIPFSLFYVFLSLQLIKSNQLNIRLFFSDVKDKELSGIKWTLMALMLTLVFDSIQLFLPDSFTELKAWQYTYAVFGLLWLVVFSLLIIRQQPLDQNASRTVNQIKAQAAKYQKSPLSVAEVEEIKSKLMEAMDVRQLYRSPGLTLQELAEAIQCSSNKISQVLNLHIEQGFYDFINSRRIRAASEALIEQHNNILEVAFEVGFNSKGTFNAAFKKYTGQTPSQYKKMHLRSQAET